MTFVAAFQQFFDSLPGKLILALAGLAALDFLLGVLAAVRDDVFEWKAVAAWARKHLAGRVLPITAILFFGYITGGIDLTDPSGQVDVGMLVSPGVILTSIGALAAAAYIAETFASIRESMTSKPADGTAGVVRTIPQD